MEGRGTITFITNDQYVGEFKDSNFNGLGCYTWSSGTSLVGVFENNLCDKVGKKTYPSGQVYVGELSQDQEHGRGVLSDQHGARIVGVWNMGVLKEELVETIVPANEVDASDTGEQEHRVFVSARPVDAGAVPSQDLTTAAGAEEGRSLVIFTNGDKYIGGLKNGMKQGAGMYVYADGSAYKGTWEHDSMDGVAHPLGPQGDSEETQRLHEMNQRTVEATDTLRTKLLSDKKQVPPVFKLQDS